MIIAAIIATLIGSGVYMLLQRGMLRIIVGITLLSHGVNLLILATGIGAWRTEPLMDRATAGEAADPLPQAFVLTAIVISMASTAVMLAMSALGRDDDTRSSDDPESGFRRYRSFQTMGREMARTETETRGKRSWDGKGSDAGAGSDAGDRNGTGAETGTDAEAGTKQKLGMAPTKGCQKDIYSADSTHSATTTTGNADSEAEK